MKPSAEETIISEKYREYQHRTQGLDIWEEGAFRAGWKAHEEHAHNSVEELKKEHETHVIALEALAKVLNREKGELREENDNLKSNFLLMSEERDKQLELVDKLRKERDEELKSFYRWVVFDNDSLPTNSTDLDNLISEYKKTLEQ